MKHSEKINILRAAGKLIYIITELYLSIITISRYSTDVFVTYLNISSMATCMLVKWPRDNLVYCLGNEKYLKVSVLVPRY